MPAPAGSRPQAAALRARLVRLAVAAVLAGCSAPPAPPAASPAGAEGWYRQAAAAGKQVLTVVSAESLIAVRVQRAGPLARLGHDHLIASRALTGFVAPAEGRADLQLRADQLTVDEPLLRQQAGLATQPSPDAVAGTRTNMLDRVFDAARFPVVLLHAERLPGPGNRLRLAVTLHGVTRMVELPVLIEADAGSLRASGTLLLRQSDFGITPFAVMGGLISVQDALELRFHIVARGQAHAPPAS